MVVHPSGVAIPTFRTLLPLLATGLLAAQTAPQVTEAPLRAHLAFLSDDMLEGRGTGQRGGELTVRYLETQLQVLGLHPAQGASYRQPVPLDLRAEGTLVSEVRTVPQFNVAGVVPGTDPKLKDEVVIYSAHWDHLGKGAAPAPDAHGDSIYNGAVDNASGCAALLAMAQAALHHPARRSQLFLFVCAAEQGLLGSRGYAAHPLWPLATTAADLNLDSLNVVAPTRDIGLPFANRSTLGALGAAVAQADHLVVGAPRPDTVGGYFRSNHYSFVQVGVPAVSIHGGHDFITSNLPAAQAEAEAYGARYHQVTDEYDPAWDLAGMVQQAPFTLDLGQAVANAPTKPTFKSAR